MELEIGKMVEIILAFYICLSINLSHCTGTIKPWRAEVQFKQGDICHVKINENQFNKHHFILGPEFPMFYGWTHCDSLKKYDE